jgi:hypothetical protein
MKPFDGPLIVTISPGDRVRMLVMPANFVLLRRRWSAASAFFARHRALFPRPRQPRLDFRAGSFCCILPINPVAMPDRPLCRGRSAAPADRI